MNSFPRASLGLAGRFRPFLLDVFNFVDQIVSHFDQLLPFTFAPRSVRLPSIHQVQVRHRIVKVRPSRKAPPEKTL
jgi:hypothetical protein